MADFPNGLNGPHVVKLVEADHQSEPVNATVLHRPLAVNNVVEVNLNLKNATPKSVQVG